MSMSVRTRPAWGNAVISTTKNYRLARYGEVDGDDGIDLGGVAVDFGGRVAPLLDGVHGGAGQLGAGGL